MAQIIILKNKLSEEILSELRKFIDSISITDPVQMAKSINNFLNKNYGKDWNYFLGRNMYGEVSYVENSYVEFDMEAYRYIFFKTYNPN